jgi:deoxyhypusine synthase
VVGGRDILLKTKSLRPVLPVDVQAHSRVVDLLREMGQTAFQGKNLSHAVRIWCEMLQEEVTIFLGIAGAMMLGMKVQGHRYAIQVTTDAPHWGGLSGCTFEEAQSWGKISEGVDKVTVYCDSTIALPLLVAAIAQAKHDLRFRRTPPRMKKLWASPKKKRREGTSPR